VGSLVDFTGSGARLQVRSKYGATEKLIELTTENGGIEPGADGSIQLTISATTRQRLSSTGRCTTWRSFRLQGSPTRSPRATGCPASGCQPCPRLAWPAPSHLPTRASVYVARPRGADGIATDPDQLAVRLDDANRTSRVSTGGTHRESRRWHPSPDRLAVRVRSTAACRYAAVPFEQWVMVSARWCLSGVECVKAGEDAPGCCENSLGGVGHDLGFFALGRPVAHCFGANKLARSSS
jgi:hypothetical protein